MAKNDINIAVELANAVLEAAINSLGVPATRGILEKSFPQGEVTLNNNNQLDINGPNREETVKKAIEALVEKMTVDFGYNLPEHTLQTAYTVLKKSHNDYLGISKMLDFVPEGFLEEEKIKYLSKEELEKQVLEKTKALRAINEHLEEKVLERTKELTEANTRLLALDKVKSDFVSVAAHQLRTPLSEIKWAITSLVEGESGKLNKKQLEVLQKSLNSTQSLIELANDLLNTAKLEEGQVGYETKPQSIVPIVQKSIAGFDIAIKEKNISLKLSLPDESLPKLNLDEEKMGVAIDNVLDNAIKYTHPGGSITVNIFWRDSGVAIDIKDTGIGIPPDQAYRVFSKFFRAKNAQLYQTSGTGLGLYMVKTIVENLGGTVSFESKEGEGSTFSIFFPVINNKS